MNRPGIARRITAHGIALIALLAILTACGQEPAEAPAEPADVAPVAEEAPAPADTTTPGSEEPAAELEPVEESPGDEPGELEAEPEEILLAQSDPEEEPAAGQQQWRFEEGNHYQLLTTAQGTSSSPDKIEVAEIFWYGCPHCYRFDPYLVSWQADLADDVSFVRLPVMWNPTNEIHARVFYTAEALGKLEVMHDAIFEEMHLNNRTLTREDEIRQFFGKFEVSPEEFNATFRSFAVESKLRRARNLTERYRVRSVPLLVVNGKYTVKGDDVKSFEDMIEVADELVARERL